MEYNEFKSKIEELYLKARFKNRIVVFDEDKIGYLFVDEEGKMYFFDKNWNWIETPYNIHDVENIRYDVYCDLEKPTVLLQSDIHIHFFGNECINLYEEDDGDEEHMIIYYDCNDDIKSQAIMILKEKCECKRNSYYYRYCIKQEP